MAGRIRTIKPEWLEDELMIGTSDAARVMSIALLLLADDHGNGRAGMKNLANIFPGGSLNHVATALDELIGIRYVSIYVVNDQRYFSIRNWAKHQRVNKPGAPRVPPPTEIGAIFESTSTREHIAKLNSSNFPLSSVAYDKTTDFPGGISGNPEKPGLIPIPIPIPIPTSTPIPIPLFVRGKPKEPTEIARVRKTFLDGYAARYPAASKYPWGSRENGQAKNWLKSVPAEEAIELVTWFFAWQRAEVVKAGHAFCTGSNSLVMKYHELRADLSHPERRAFAAAMNGDEKQANNEAEGAAQVKRVMAKLMEKHNAIGSGESNGNLGSVANTVRGVQSASFGFVAAGVGRLPAAAVRTGAAVDAESGMPAENHAGPRGYSGDDDGSSEAEHQHRSGEDFVR